MKLATFNIESYGCDRFDPAGLRPRIGALRPRIEELDADSCAYRKSTHKR
nr:hypothetical protein [uncultured Roseibium sp.]